MSRTFSLVSLSRASNMASVWMLLRGCPYITSYWFWVFCKDPPIVINCQCYDLHAPIQEVEGEEHLRKCLARHNLKLIWQLVVCLRIERVKWPWLRRRPKKTNVAIAFVRRRLQEACRQAPWLSLFKQIHM